MNLGTYLGTIRKMKRDSGHKLIFRGQSNAIWKLQSTAARRLERAGYKTDDIFEYTAEYIDYHKHLMDKADRLVPFGQNSLELSFLERLAELQHFGVATGLLDFTWNPLNALWFAVSDHPECDGSVFVLDDSVNNTDYVSTIRHGDNIDSLFSVYSSTNKYSYFLSDPRAVGDAATRIINQKSIFVIPRPIVDSNCIRRIDIAANDKNALLQELENVNISSLSIFQDLIGLSKTDNHESDYEVPRTHSAYLRRAVSETRRGDYSAALNYYNKSINLDPSEIVPYYHRANIQYALGNLRESVDDFDIVIASGANIQGLNSGVIPQSYFNRGNINVYLKKLQNAELDYQKALELDPNFIEAKYNLGNLYFATHRFDLAATKYSDVYRSAMRTEGRFDALMNLSLTNLVQGKFNEMLGNYTLMRQFNLRSETKALVDRQLNHVLYILELLEDIEETGLCIDVHRETNQILVRVMHPNFEGAHFTRGFKGLKGYSGNVGDPPGNGSAGDSGITVVIGDS